MNFKYAVLYRYERLAKLAGIVYILTAVPCIGLIASFLYYKVNYFELSANIIFYVTLVLSLIFGVTSYEGDFKFFLQNGITRQQTHFSFMATLPVCLIISFIERALSYIMSIIFNKSSSYDKVDHMFADYFPCDKSFIKDMLIGALVLITLMSLTYMIKCIVKSFKPLTLILIVVVLIAIVGMDMGMEQLNKKIYSELSYVPQLFFLGSLYGERLLRHFVASLTIVNIFMLSVSHIITLKIPVKSRGE